MKSKSLNLNSRLDIAEQEQLRYNQSRIFEKQIACEWLSTKEAAHFLSISENALRIKVHRDEIPCYRFGRRLRFRRTDCEALFVKKGA